MTPHPIRVAVVNHRVMFRSRFKHLMEVGGGIQIVGEAGLGEVACDCYDQWNADIIILDMGMPGIGGLETLRRLRKHDRKARILVTSNHNNLSHPGDIQRHRWISCRSASSTTS